MLSEHDAINAFIFLEYSLSEHYIENSIEANTKAQLQECLLVKTPAGALPLATELSP